MTREYEFRGKSKYNNEFVYGDLIKIHTKNGSGYGIQKLPYHINDNCANPIPDEIIPETVGQYTGLKDKNGTKVFEGDIIQWTIIKCQYKVLFDNHITVWGYYFKDVHGDYVTFPSLTDKEIIGNIFDNPELLK